MIKTVSTGVAGLDEMLDGGFPEGRIILVCGGPGTGKTLFCLQFLMGGAERNEIGIYVTLEEPLELVKANSLSLSWELEKYVDEGTLKLVDFTDITYSVSPEKISFERTVEEFKALKPNRIAVDPINSITLRQASASGKRLEFAQIFKRLRELKAVTLITMEQSSLIGEFFMEEYLADGVILLSKTIDERFNLLKTIRVEKMRGTKYDEQPRRYEITNKGFRIYNTEEVRA